MRATGNLLVALTTCLLAFATSYPLVAWTESRQEYSIEIERQPLMRAIRAFVNQTGLYVGFFPETPADEDILVGPISGTLTADVALRELLQPNGLDYEWMSEGSIYVVRRQETTQTTTQDFQRIERRWPGDRRPYDVDSMIVVGTRLTTGETEPQSIAVLNEQQIDSYGVSTLGELFGHLPQVPFVRFDGFRRSGEQFADLRGFGSGTTLVLINGRRVFGTATSLDSNAFDINTIPLTAIRRIEIVLDVPSVATATDASGGAINIVLKDNIQAPTLELRYGTADGGNEERRASFGIGAAGEYGHGAVTLDLFDRSQLLGMERAITRDQDYRRFGGRDTRTLDTSPANVRSLSGGNLPGLDSSFAAVPFGSSGVGLTPDDFAATAGQRNLGSPRRLSALAPDITRASLIASGEMPLVWGMTGFAELLSTHRRIDFQTGESALSGAVVPASNAFNPFGAPVIVNRALSELPSQRVITEGLLTRAVTGARRDWNRWTAQAWVSATRDRVDQRNENALDAARTAQALASSAPSQALNPFRDGAAGSDALLGSLLATPQTRTYAANSTQLYALAQGPLASLPAGDWTLTIGGEWRTEEWRNDLLPSSPQRDIGAAFAETRIPLVRSTMAVPGVESLSFSLGLRGEEYSDLGSRVTPQYGILWSPVPGATLRGSYSDLQRAPSLDDVYGSRVSAPVTLQDPRRGGEASTFTFLGGGNRELDMSSGGSWTIGLELAPSATPDLRFSASYWHTTIEDQVATLPILTLLANEHAFSDRVVRAEPTAQDIAAGLPGKLYSVNLIPRNSSILEASGADARLSFTLETRFGSFSPAVAAAWYEHFALSLGRALPPERRVGIASEFGTIPRWRANASLGWSRGALSLFTIANVTAAYADASLGVQTGRNIDEQVQLDVQAALRLDPFVAQDSLLKRVKLTAGVANLLSAEQQFSTIALGTAGFDPSQAALLRQRFWYVRLAKEL